MSMRLAPRPHCRLHRPLEAYPQLQAAESLAVGLRSLQVAAPHTPTERPRHPLRLKECASDLNDPEHQNVIFRMAKQMVKERQDITGSNRLKGVLGKVIVDEKGKTDV